jgi:NADPH:quinone reductase-like Zn-dependent oxidoreductase
MGEGVVTLLPGQKVCALVAGAAMPNIAWPKPASACPCQKPCRWRRPRRFPKPCSPCGTTCSSAAGREGETLLVHGGTSGIGSMAIMLGKLFDLTVIVTCGGRTSARRAGDRRGPRDRLQGERLRRGSGADHRRQGRPIVLDMVAGDYVARNIKCLRDDGRHVTIAVQGASGPRSTWPK